MLGLRCKGIENLLSLVRTTSSVIQCCLYDASVSWWLTNTLCGPDCGLASLTSSASFVVVTSANVAGLGFRVTVPEGFQPPNSHTPFRTFRIVESFEFLRRNRIGGYEVFVSETCELIRAESRTPRGLRSLRAHLKKGRNNNVALAALLPV